MKWAKEYLALVEKRQNRYVNFAVNLVEKEMESIIDIIWKSWETTGNYHAPTMEKLDQIFVEFYAKVLSGGINTSKEILNMQGPVKRLALYKEPKSLKDFEKLFRNKKFWPSILKRSKKLVARLRRAYLLKLENRFKKIVPQILSNEITPKEAKEQLREEFKSTRHRVETIFRTETTTYFSKSQNEYFKNSPDLIGYLFDSVRDIASTDICRARHGLVYRPGTKLLAENMPACFSCETPILTLDGWKRIDCITIADYVLTHEFRWKRVEKIYRSEKESSDLLQIGFAMATSDHPYFERGLGFVEAKHFRPEKGIFTGSLNLFAMLKAAMGSMVSSGPKILFYSMSRFIIGSYSKRRTTSTMERWASEVKRRLPWLILSESPKSESSWPGAPAYSCHGEVYRSYVDGYRDSSSYKPHKNRQQDRKSTNYESRRSFQSSHESILVEKETVFNLTVEDDHTYFAGGYLVHNCHYNCRSHLVPLADIPENRKLLNDPSRSPSNRKVPPLPPGWRK